MNDHNRIALRRAFHSAMLDGEPPANVLHYVAEMVADADPVPCRDEGGPSRIVYELDEDTGVLTRTVFA